MANTPYVTTSTPFPAAIADISPATVTTTAPTTTTPYGYTTTAQFNAHVAATNSLLTDVNLILAALRDRGLISTV